MYLTARWSTSFNVHYILHTEVLGLGVDILVNGAIYLEILLWSRSKIVKNIADRQKMMLWQYYKAPETINVSQIYKGYT